jgi:hypothetical protein
VQSEELSEPLAREETPVQVIVALQQLAQLVVRVVQREPEEQRTQAD